MLAGPTEGVGLGVFSLYLSCVPLGEIEAQGGTRKREPWVLLEGAEQEWVSVGAEMGKGEWGSLGGDGGQFARPVLWLPSQFLVWVWGTGHPSVPSRTGRL